jgi:YhcH/YjgK/YiaL family protein
MVVGGWLHRFCCAKLQFNLQKNLYFRKEVFIMIVCPWKDLGRYAAVLPGLEEAVEQVNALTSFEDKTYPLSDGNRFFVANGTTKPVDVAEAHRQYLDIQYIVKGKEVMGWADLAACGLIGEFNDAKDIGKYTGNFEYLTIREGMCYVAFPEDVHMPGRHLDVPNDFVKVVVKLKV